MPFICDRLLIDIIQDNSKYQCNELEKMAKRSNTQLYGTGDCKLEYQTICLEEAKASKLIPKLSSSDFDFLISGFPVKFR